MIKMGLLSNVNIGQVVGNSLGALKDVGDELYKRMERMNIHNLGSGQKQISDGNKKKVSASEKTHVAALQDRSKGYQSSLAKDAKGKWASKAHEAVQTGADSLSKL